MELHVSIVEVTSCVVGVFMSEGPEYSFPMVTHVLCISKFEHLGVLGICYIFTFP